MGIIPADIKAKQVIKNIHTGYTKYIDIDVMRELVPYAVEILKTFDFDALAFRGVSGAIIAPVLALELRKSIIVVRKTAEKSHLWGRTVQGDNNARRYIIVDDFIDSGATVQTIVKEILLWQPHAVCLGVLEMHSLDDMTTRGAPFELSRVPCLKEPDEWWRRKAEPVAVPTNPAAVTLPGERLFACGSTGDNRIFQYGDEPL